MLRRFLTCLILLLWAPGALAQPSVKDVRIGKHGERTRFVLELSEAPAYRAFTLPDPFRVVIDLPELNWQVDPQGLPAGGGLVDALRYGLFAPGTSRVVLDVLHPVEFERIFLLTPSDGYAYRLVVDLVPVSRQAYFSAARRPLVSDPPLPQPQQAALPQAPPKPEEDERPVIVIDPGHGGVDPGAIGRSGIYEKDLVLAYARELRRHIEASGRYRVHMTRDSDVFIRLRDRIAHAHQVGGDLFISVHANTHARNDLRGASVYTLSETASDAEAAALAAKENKADVIAGVDLSDQPEVVSKILIDLAQRETMNQSKIFANLLTKEMGSTGPLLRKPHRSAGFAVLKSPTVPSVLVELGYLSNRSEEGLLRSEGHRRKIVDSVLRAVDGYFEWQQNARRS